MGQQTKNTQYEFMNLGPHVVGITEVDGRAINPLTVGKYLKQRNKQTTGN
jgi:hypothetical protein